MANLTLVIDDQLLQAARIKALQQGTSVNEICREAIANFTLRDEAAAARLATLRGVATILGELPRSSYAPAWAGRDAFYAEVLGERGLSVQEPGPTP
jgi:hypothetical protein